MLYSFAAFCVACMRLWWPVFSPCHINASVPRRRLLAAVYAFCVACLGFMSYAYILSCVSSLYGLLWGLRGSFAGSSMPACVPSLFALPAGVVRSLFGLPSFPALAVRGFFVSFPSWVVRAVFVGPSWVLPAWGPSFPSQLMRSAVSRSSSLFAWHMSGRSGACCLRSLFADHAGDTGIICGPCADPAADPARASLVHCQQIRRVLGICPGGRRCADPVKRRRGCRGSFSD